VTGDGTHDHWVTSPTPWSLDRWLCVCLIREQRIPVAVLRKREVKWLEMLENWEKWMSKRFRKASCSNHCYWPAYWASIVLLTGVCYHWGKVNVRAEGREQCSRMQELRWCR